MSFMEGERGESMLQEFKNKFAMTFTVDCLYWLPVQVSFFSYSYFEKSKKDALSVYPHLKIEKKDNLIVILIFQALNFLFVPPGFRILYIGLTTFLWLNVLCYIKSSPH